MRRESEIIITWAPATGDLFESDGDEYKLFVTVVFDSRQNQYVSPNARMAP